MERLKYLTRQFCLPSTILKPGPNDRPHTLPPRIATFFEAIILRGAFIPLHHFLVKVFNYFNVIPFQFISNSILTMLAFCFAFMEADIGKPSMVEFTYIYYIKALVKSEGFWYTSKRGPNVEGVWGVCDNIGNYKD